MNRVQGPFESRALGDYTDMWPCSWPYKWGSQGCKHSEIVIKRMPLRGSCTQSCGGTEQGAAQSRVEMAFNFPGEVGESLNGKDFMTLS